MVHFVQTMRPSELTPLTREEHCELGSELRRTRARIHELSALISQVYGPNNRAAFSFLKAAESIDRLCVDMQSQVSRDLPGYETDGLYQ